jgi:hypothetical protein
VRDFLRLFLCSSQKPITKQYFCCKLIKKSFFESGNLMPFSPVLYQHRFPILYRLEQWGAMLLAILIVFAAIGLMLLAFLIPAPLFGLMALLLPFLLAPVLMLTLVAPPVWFETEGLRIKPYFWPERFITWQEIEAVKLYTLLPSANQEVLRQVAVGRKQYRAAYGIMLIVPSLPAPYRIAGYFAGEKGAPIIAITNRSHNYSEGLIDRIFVRKGLDYEDFQ